MLKLEHMKAGVMIGQVGENGGVAIRHEDIQETLRLLLEGLSDFHMAELMRSLDANTRSRMLDVPRAL
jgi:hypothetical protein